jgi:hypothetical protein
MKKKKTIFVFITLINVLSFQLLAQTQVVYDVVLSGGRVIDPETKLDAIKNVGILNNRIAQISSETLQGK